MPVAVQIVTQDPQQQQHHDAGAEGHQLHDALGAAPAQVGDPEAPGDADPAAQAPREIHQQHSGERQHQHEGRERGGEGQEQFPLRHHPVNQQQHHRYRRTERQQHQRRRRTDVAAQHPQRRHARELQERGQCEPRQQRDRGHEADGERAETRRRQIGDRQEPADGAQQPLLGEEPERRARHGREQRQRQQLQHRHRQREGPRRAEGLEQCHGIQVPVHVAARGHRHRDRAQQHAHQARQAQEAPGALHGVADLGARLGDVPQALTGALVGDEPGLEGIDARALAGEQRAVAHAAAGLDEARGRQVGRIHDEVRRQLGKSAALVGPGDQHPGHAQARRSDRELRAHVPADRREQLRVRPRLARSGNACCG